MYGANRNKSDEQRVYDLWNKLARSSYSTLLALTETRLLGATEPDFLIKVKLSVHAAGTYFSETVPRKVLGA